MPEESYSGEINEATVIFSALMRINALSSAIFSDTSTDWQVNVRNYTSAVTNFESTVVRHLDKEYRDNLKRLVMKYRMKLEKHKAENPADVKTDIGKEFEMNLSLNYTHKKLALIMRQLDSKGVLDEVSVHAVPQGTDEQQP